MQNHTCNERQEIGQEGCRNNRAYSVLLNGWYRNDWQISRHKRTEKVNREIKEDPEMPPQKNPCSWSKNRRYRLWGVFRVG